MAYCGCRTCCNKVLWFLFVIYLVGAAVLLGLGLSKSIPCAREGLTCTKGTTIDGQKICWNEFWTCNGTNGLYFILTCAGIVAFFLSLFTCCCFLCSRKPRYSGKDQQFIAGTGPVDGAAPAGGAVDQAHYPDQYAAYNPAAPVGTKPGAHYV